MIEWGCMYQYIYWPDTKSICAALSVLAVVLLVTILHISVGAKSLAWWDIYQAISHFDSHNYDHHIVINQRLPRLLVAMGCGAMLGIAGFKAQKLLQNPLVSSSTLGVNSGAVFISLCAMYFFNITEDNLFLPAFAGACLAGIFTLSMSRALHRSSISKGLHIVLAGSLVSMLFGALSTFLIQLDPLRFADIQDWLLGDIGPSDFNDFKAIFWLALATVILLLSQGRALDAMMLGERQAQSAGVNVKKTKLLTLTSVFMLASLVVSTVGPIGFIGLVVPHICKIFVTETGQIGAWLSMLIGALLLACADIVARTIIAPKVLLVGGVSASIGSVFFLALLYFMLRKKPVL